MEFLNRKLFGLPYWAIGLLVAAAVVAFILWRRSQGSSLDTTASVPGASVTPSPSGGGGWGDTWGTPQPVGPGSTGADTGVVTSGGGASGSSMTSGPAPTAAQVPQAATSVNAIPLASSGPGTEAFAKAHGPITGSTLTGSATTATATPAARTVAPGFKAPQFRKY